MNRLKRNRTVKSFLDPTDTTAASLLRGICAAVVKKTAESPLSAFTVSVSVFLLESHADVLEIS